MKISTILTFSYFLNAVRSPKLSFATAYKLSKLTSAIETELAFYREKMQEIAHEYALRDDGGNFVYSQDGLSIIIKPEAQLECRQKITELENLEVELPNIKFSVEEFADTTLSLDELQPILPFIED